MLQELTSNFEKNIAANSEDSGKSLENFSDNSLEPSDSEPSANSSVTIIASKSFNYRYRNFRHHGSQKPKAKLASQVACQTIAEQLMTFPRRL